eukprot:6232778-Amphidinium_carterae.1
MSTPSLLQEEQSARKRPRVAFSLSSQKTTKLSSAASKTACCSFDGGVVEDAVDAPALRSNNTGATQNTFVEHQTSSSAFE